MNMIRLLSYELLLLTDNVALLFEEPTVRTHVVDRPIDRFLK